MCRPFVGVAVVAAIMLSACGNPGGDIIAIEVREPRAGTPIQRLVVTDDGRGSCNGGELERLESARLLEAREVQRELDELPGERTDFGRLESRRSYRAVMRDATVTWAEGARRPEVLPKATLLALNLRRELCGGSAGGGGAPY
ncbi:MAG: hypothetical protein M3340_13315 [Actinomycetota bacterium]|nr:hypothetical protein [Actinomycetota bacterium]